MTRYLKKPGSPEWDFFIWTPLLEARGDLVPYEPPAAKAIASPAPEEKDAAGGLVDAPVVKNVAPMKRVIGKPAVKSKKP